MTEYSETCHYEMKDKARAQYKKDKPQYAGNDCILANVMSDFDGKGYVSTYPINCIEEEIVYQFDFLKSL